MVMSHSAIARFKGKTQDDLIREIPTINAGQGHLSLDDYLRLFCMTQDGGIERLHFLWLPGLTKATARRWWKGAIEQMVESRFVELLNNPLWLRELRAVSSGTEADMRKELKDYCREKVNQFV